MGLSVSSDECNIIGPLALDPALRAAGLHVPTPTQPDSPVSEPRQPRHLMISYVPYEPLREALERQDNPATLIESFFHSKRASLRSLNVPAAADRGLENQKRIWRLGFCNFQTVGSQSFWFCCYLGSTSTSCSLEALVGAEYWNTAISANPDRLRLGSDSELECLAMECA